MAGIATIRDELRLALDAIDGLRVQDVVVDSIAPPVAVIGFPDRIEFDVTMRRGADRLLIPVRLYVGRASDRAAQDKLDAYLAPSGVFSIKAAIEDDPTLGGACQTLRVTEASGYGVYDVAGIPYLGVQFVVEVIA